MAVLLSYFSRRPLLMRVVGVVVTTGTLARYLHIHNNIYNIISHSLALGSLVAGTRGNGWAVAGAAVLSIAASVHTRCRDIYISIYLHIYIYISTYLPHDSHVTHA